MDRQKEFVLRTLEERDIRFVRLWFTDVLGFLKSVAIAPAELEGAFEEGIGFDGSSIEGFARVSESDTVAHPDPSTFQVLPWTTKSGHHHSARMFCDIKMPDGSPSWADPRHVLRRQLGKANDLAARMFTDDIGKSEDPATGSAAGCLAGYLVEHGYLGAKPVDVRVEQGYEIGAIDEAMATFTVNSASPTKNATC